MHRIRINHGRLVPLTFRLVGSGIIIFSCIQVLNHLPEVVAIFIVIALSLLLPILWFSFEMISIDNDTKEIHDGYWIMGYRIGKPKKYENIDKFYINKVSTSQTLNTRVNSYNRRGSEFHVYLKLSNGDKYFLTSQPSETKAEEKADWIKKKLAFT